MDTAPTHEPDPPPAEMRRLLEEARRDLVRGELVGRALRDEERRPE